MLGTLLSINMDYQFTMLTHEHRFLFIIAMLTIAFSIILMSVKLLISEIVILFLFYAIQESTSSIIYLILMVVQIGIGIYMIYRYLWASHYNTQLILEKIRLAPRRHTRGGNDGTMRPF